MKKKVWRSVWLLAPLLVVAWTAAPEWPARTAMMDSPWRDVWYPVATSWSAVHPVAPEQDTPGDVPASPAAANPTVVASASDTVIVTPANSGASSVVSVQVDPAHATTAAIQLTDDAAGVTPPNPATPASAGTPATPKSVLAIGDSLMGEVAAGFRTGLPRDIAVYDRHKSSTGLTNQGYYNWPEVARQAALETKPTDVVIHMGGNDAQDMMVGGHWIRFGSDDWLAQYKARALLMIANIRAASPGVRIIWVGLPAMRSDVFDAKVQKLVSAQKAAAKEAGVPFFDGHVALGATFSKDGPDNAGHRRLLRADDGIHYSREGGRLIAREVSTDATVAWPWQDKG
jgi:hypothetical protein